MKSEEEIMANQSMLSKADQESMALGSTLRKTGAALMKGAPGRKQSGFIASEAASSVMDMNAISSRLGDSALRKMQAQAGSAQDLPKESKMSFKAVANVVGAVSFLSKLTANS